MHGLSGDRAVLSKGTCGVAVHQCTRRPEPIRCAAHRGRSRGRGTRAPPQQRQRSIRRRPEPVKLVEVVEQLQADGALPQGLSAGYFDKFAPPSYLQSVPQPTLSALLAEARLDQAVKVKFRVNKPTAWGERVVVAGSSASLGTWVLSDSAPLQWSDGHWWHGEVMVPADSHHEFKFVLMKPKGPEWEAGSNRELHAPASSQVHFSTSWGEAAVPTVAYNSPLPELPHLCKAPNQQPQQHRPQSAPAQVLAKQHQPAAQPHHSPQQGRDRADQRDPHHHHHQRHIPDTDNPPQAPPQQQQPLPQPSQQQRSYSIARIATPPPKADLAHREYTAATQVLSMFASTPADCGDIGNPGWRPRRLPSATTADSLMLLVEAARLSDTPSVVTHRDGEFVRHLGLGSCNLPRGASHPTAAAAVIPCSSQPTPGRCGTCTRQPGAPRTHSPPSSPGTPSCAAAAAASAAPSHSAIAVWDTLCRCMAALWVNPAPGPNHQPPDATMANFRNRSPGPAHRHCPTLSSSSSPGISLAVPWAAAAAKAEASASVSRQRRIIPHALSPELVSQQDEPPCLPASASMDAAVGIEPQVWRKPRASRELAAQLLVQHLGLAAPDSHSPDTWHVAVVLESFACLCSTGFIPRHLAATQYCSWLLRQGDTAAVWHSAVHCALEPLAVWHAAGLGAGVGRV